MLTIWIVLVLLIVGETAVLFAFESAPRTLEQRFSDLGIKVRVGRKAFGDERDQGTARMLLHWAARRLPAPKSDSPKGEKLNQMLLQAGFTGSNALRIYGAVRVGSAVVGAVLALAVSLIANGHLTSVCTAGGAVAGFLIPSYYLAAHARRRQRAIARDLSDTLDLLVVSVEAGLALQEAIKMVGAEAERYGRPIGSELGLVTSEMLAGASLGQALRAWAKRTAVVGHQAPGRHADSKRTAWRSDRSRVARILRRPACQTPAASGRDGAKGRRQDSFSAGAVRASGDVFGHPGSAANPKPQDSY
jgi:tight adherence protein C